MGRQSVAAIVGNFALELVGCYAWSPDKVGHDVGDIDEMTDGERGERIAEARDDVATPGGHYRRELPHPVSVGDINTLIRPCGPAPGPRYGRENRYTAERRFR